jgi:hypothetical protein
MAIVHPCTIAKTDHQEKFEALCESNFPGYYNFHRSDLHRGDYQDELTRHTYAGYQIALGLVAWGKPIELPQ